MTDDVVREIAERREKVRDIICRTVLGYEYESLYKSKADWTNDRGARHEINTPFRGDVDAGVDEILSLLREALTPKPLVKFGENLGAVLTHEKLEELAALEPSPFPLDDGWRDLQMDPPPRDGRQKIFICRNGSIFVADHIEAKEISVSERRKIYEATGDWPSADWTPTHWRRPPSPPGQR